MDEMSLSEAAAECAKWGRTIQAFEKVREVASTLQGLEQNIAERSALLSQLGRQIESAKADLIDTQVKVTAARKASGDLVAEARARAQVLVDDAKTAAEKIKKESAAAAELAAADLAGSRDAQAEAERATAAAIADLAATLDKIEAAKAAARQVLGA